MKQVSTIYRRYKDAKAVIESLLPAVQKAREEAEAAGKVKEIIQAFAKTVQEQTYGRMSRLVSECLKAVFDDPYSFNIICEKKRGKAEARFVFTRNGEDFDPMTECGGGVLDVAAFALRLAALRPLSGKVRQILFLDEPFRHVSKNHSSRLAALVTSLSEQTGIQLVIITHNEELNCGKIIRL